MTELLLEGSATTLRDGREVVIRLLTIGDRATLTAFGRALPPDDLQYIPDDFQSPDVIARLINMCSAENWRQIVATYGAAIVGYAAVRRLSGWSSHVGQIHLIIGRGWRRCGLGTTLAAAIFDAAHELGASQVIVEMLEEQAGGRAIFERLGFSIEGLLEGQVCDRRGQQHNLLVMGYQL